MGKLLPFRRRSRWTRASSYALPSRHATSRFRRRISFFVLRPFLLAAILVSLWIGLDPGLVDPPAILLGEPETVSMTFSRCGPGRREACVIDGDTFKLGERKIRIVGIDAAEVHAECPQEAQLAEAATVHLLELLNQGPFEMVARLDDPHDRYGRELRTLRRRGQSGEVILIADQMTNGGHARRYWGALRQKWC